MTTKCFGKVCMNLDICFSQTKVKGQGWYINVPINIVTYQMKAPFKSFYLVQEWDQSLSILMNQNKGKFKENLKFQRAL
jgi:hypothetical protein